MKKLMFAVMMLCAALNLANVGANANAEEWGDYTYERIEDGIEIKKYNGNDSIVEIPSEINGVQVKKLAYYAFKKNESIQEVYIPDGVEVMYNSFCYCTNLKKVHFPKTMTVIGSAAFYKCKSLERVVLPEGIRHVSVEAFSCCDGLKYVVVPNSVELLCEGSFYKSNNIESIVFYNPNTEIPEPTEFFRIEVVHFPMERMVPVYPVFSIMPRRIYSFAGGCVEAFAIRNGIELILISNVVINGIKLYCDTPCYIKDGRTMAPMRAIFEALGAEMSWDDTTKTAVGVKDGEEVKITIGENVLYRNGEGIELDCAAEITDDRTMVPVRAISEAFGCSVNWIDETKTVEITN